MGNVNSPCINVCRLDKNNFCIGCFRTISEIANWTKYTDAEKMIVLDKLNKRQWQKLKQEL
jgi:predicted Fe-S protein YdhL (DUF1289 family)